ncbi:MAG: hypothetical protein AAF497_01060 [Planctomycetota bacterium]
MSTANYLDRYFEPITQVLTPEVAQQLVSLQPDPVMAARVAELGQKSDAGTLTDEERAEYKDYVDAGTLISLIKAKARRFLSQHP